MKKYKVVESEKVIGGVQCVDVVYRKKVVKTFISEEFALRWIALQQTDEIASKLIRKESKREKMEYGMESVPAEGGVIMTDGEKRDSRPIDKVSLFKMI